MEHTPGPWAVVSNMDLPERIDLLHVDSSEANARLIAAAPELLEACKLLVFLVDHADAVRQAGNELDVEPGLATYPTAHLAITKAGPIPKWKCGCCGDYLGKAPARPTLICSKCGANASWVRYDQSR